MLRLVGRHSQERWAPRPPAAVHAGRRRRCVSSIRAHFDLGLSHPVGHRCALQTHWPSERFASNVSRCFFGGTCSLSVTADFVWIALWSVPLVLRSTTAWRARRRILLLRRLRRLRPGRLRLRGGILATRPALPFRTKTHPLATPTDGWIAQCLCVNAWLPGGLGARRLFSGRRQCDTWL